METLFTVEQQLKLQSSNKGCKKKTYNCLLTKPSLDQAKAQLKACPIYNLSDLSDTQNKAEEGLEGPWHPL